MFSGKREKFTTLLKKLNLHEKFPQKLSFKDAMKIRQETLETVHTVEKLPVLPYLILQKIMMCDQRCRSSLFNLPSLTTQSDPRDSAKELSDSESNDSELSDSDSDDAGVDDDGLHPLDCILAILHCCDDILRQKLFSKLSLCQLALPFLLPNPTDNSVTFLLWAMRSLFRGWKCYKTGEKECRIVDYQGPIVSFLRIGNPQASKSEILNAVIGGESKIFFYRRECEGGDCKRNFVDGLVEMCSYFPSGKENDLFSDAITFLNLRGNAQQHSKQVEFLQKVSCVSVVLISDAATNKDNMEILKQLEKSSGGIILIYDEDAHKETKSNARKLRQALLNSSKIKLNEKKTVKSIATLKKEVRESLVNKISQVTAEKYLAISNCCQIAREANIKIDEDGKYSKIGKSHADMVMKEIKLGQTKDKMLPLQGPSLWQKWAKHHKEKYRHAEKKVDVNDYNEKQDKEKRKVRKKQLDHCTNLTPVMDCFLKHLQEKNITIRRYFLLWLKLFLDDYSRQVLPKLHAEYQETRDQLYALKQGNQSNDNSKIMELTNKLKIQNKELIHASFGLEHLFREMGQIYEVCNDYSSGCRASISLKAKAEPFPQIIADIMEEGLYALEIMDGDASHVPVLWVLAVIEKLKNVCGKNTREINGGKTFVLAVLGIQSSGKSTLLNTLFGLHFNVSAGRCTRGAYIQFLPLDNSLRQEIDCDYVMVVDTEGLRAPELQSEGVTHDNELATFVIGLSDATIINIYGEAPGDLNDILQTSLHAFIRMRNVEMSPSCLFVHQNVPDALASSKGKMGRWNFHKKLDEMTQAAAKVENCDDQYCLFSQVIDFDDKKHVFYFPSLWKGDPPMASVNTGYSESAQILKTSLIELTQDKKTHRCTLDTFKLRAQQIWQAVLQENFVFSFKNTLEVCAYNDLDSQYAQWSWNLRSKMLEWENTTKFKINNFDTESKVVESKIEQEIIELKAQTDDQKSEIKRTIIEKEIKHTAELCLTTAKQEIFKSHKDTLEVMEEFLKSADHSDILSQWRHQTEKRIKELHDDNEKKAESYCEQLVKNKLNHVEVDHQEVVNVVKINSYITALVDESWKQAKSYNDTELEKMFEKTWKQWMDDFKTKTAKTVEYPSPTKIDDSIVKILRELMETDDHLVRNKLSHKEFGERTKSCSMELKINKDIHLAKTSANWLNWGSSGNSESADEFTTSCLLKAREYLDEIKRDLKLFNPSFVYKVLQDLLTSITDLTKPEKKSKLKFTPEYKVDMALVVCAYASLIFKETTEKIKKANNPLTKLNKMKNDFKTKFKNKYEEVSNEKQAAIDLCALLRDSIEKAVEASLENKIVDKLMLKSHLSCKRNFNIQILEDLMMKCDSSLYKQYLRDIPECYRYWIEHYINDYVSRSPTEITDLAQLQLSKIIKKVTVIGIICMEAKATTLESLLKIFTQNVQEILPFPKNMVDAFVGSCEVGVFSKYVKDEFDTVKCKLETKFKDARSIIDDMNMNHQWISPEDLLYERLIGCSAKCPFCKEKCDMDEGHLVDHSVTLHRPVCLGGVTLTGNNKLFFKTCTESINSQEKFKCFETDDKAVKFSEYKKYFPNWHIPELECDDPKYWKWFVCEYRKDVIAWAGASDTGIPSDWFHITQADAKDSLNLHIHAKYSRKKKKSQRQNI